MGFAVSHQKHIVSVYWYNELILRALDLLDAV